MQASQLKGSAKWGTVETAIEAKILGEKSNGGVYVGAIQDKKGSRQYLRHYGPEHILAFAPTRSGKGVGLILPTLLSWRHSVFINDIKGENYALTAGFRKAIGQTVLKLDPTCIDGSGARFNPLMEIRKGTLHEVKDVQNIVQMIVDPDGKGQGDHWAKTGAALLTAVILHILYVGKNKTLSGVAGFLSDPARSIDETLEVMLKSEHISHGQEHTVYWKGIDPMSGQPTLTHPVVAQSARAVMNKSENERSGVLSTSLSFLELYRDPVVAANTECSDFKIADLQKKYEPVSLYLVVPPSDKDRLKPFVRLIINQIVRSLTEKMEFENGRSKDPDQRLLLMIDEFPSLGKMDVLAESLAFIAGYGLKAYLIVQDLSQLYAAYTKDEAIIGNCHIRIAFAPNKIETAELLSKMVGVATVQVEQNSYSGGRTSLTLGQMSSSIQEVERDLLTADEAMRMSADDCIIFVAGNDPIYGKKIKYYEDATFDARSKIKAPLISDKIIVEQLTTVVKKKEIAKPDKIEEVIHQEQKPEQIKEEVAAFEEDLLTKKIDESTQTQQLSAELKEEVVDVVEEKPKKSNSSAMADIVAGLF
jgi:type IV secretion system protein VirD4